MLTRVNILTENLENMLTAQICFNKNVHVNDVDPGQHLDRKSRKHVDRPKKVKIKWSVWIVDLGQHLDRNSYKHVTAQNWSKSKEALLYPTWRFLTIKSANSYTLDSTFNRSWIEFSTVFGFPSGGHHILCCSKIWTLMRKARFQKKESLFLWWDFKNLYRYMRAVISHPIWTSL